MSADKINVVKLKAGPTDAIDKNEMLDLIKYVIAQQYGNNQVRFAIECGISATYLNDILKGRRGIGGKVLKAIGYEKTYVYRRTGS